VCVVRVGGIGEDAGKIFDITNTCKTIFDYTQSEMIGKDINLIMPPMIARIHK
jgi:hypothetical protein